MLNRELLHQELITVRGDVLYVSKELQKANPDIDYLRRRVNDVSLGVKAALLMMDLEPKEKREG